MKMDSFCSAFIQSAEVRDLATPRIVMMSIAGVAFVSALAETNERVSNRFLALSLSLSHRMANGNPSSVTRPNYRTRRKK